MVQIENKIEKQVIFVQIKMKRVVRKGPLHGLGSFNVTALLPTSFLCPSRRWGRGEPGELAT